jgi:hypothetical protein
LSERGERFEGGKELFKVEKGKKKKVIEREERAMFSSSVFSFFLLRPRPPLSFFPFRESDSDSQRQESQRETARTLSTFSFLDRILFPPFFFFYKYKTNNQKLNFSLHFLRRLSSTTSLAILSARAAPPPHEPWEVVKVWGKKIRRREERK